VTYNPAYSVIAILVGMLLFVLWWVFLYFFLSAVVRRGIDRSVLRDQTDDLEEYHRNMVALESQKLDLMRFEAQLAQDRSQETAAFPPAHQ
jgi:hypothetical protein